MRANRLALALLFAATMSAYLGDRARADEINIVAVNAIKETLSELVSSFERASGHKVSVSWGGTEAITKRIREGEIADLVIIAAQNIDRLIAEGELTAGSRSDFAKVGIGIAVKPGAPKPDISSAEAVKKAVLAAHSVAYSTGPSGFYLADLFTKMGIADGIKNKVKQPTSGTQIADLIARGEADLGFQQISEFVHAKGIQFVGPLPAEIQNVTIYSIGPHADMRAPKTAAALVKFLTSSDAAVSIRRMGMEPG